MVKNYNFNSNPKIKDKLNLNFIMDNHLAGLYSFLLTQLQHLLTAKKNWMKINQKSNQIHQFNNKAHKFKLREWRNNHFQIKYQKQIIQHLRLQFLIQIQIIKSKKNLKHLQVLFQIIQIYNQMWSLNFKHNWMKIR